MDNELLQILSHLFYKKSKPIQIDIKDIKNSLARIENKLDSMVYQTTDLAEGRIDLLIIKSLDRFGRSYEDIIKNGMILLKL